MLVYNYDKYTKEYRGNQEADYDPEESKKQGKFVPLIPADATLIEPPKYGDKEVALFDDGWTVVTDYRNFYTVDENLNVSPIDTIQKPTTGIVIDEDLAKEIIEDPDWFYIENNKVVKKSQEQYDKDKAKKEEERINGLKMTALDLIGYIQKEGITLEEINAFLEANLSLKMQLTYCQYVYCGVVRKLTPLTIAGIEITDSKVVGYFKDKTGAN